MILNDLKIQENILSKLQLKEIDSIEKLCIISRKELKRLGFTNEEINLIAIKLQLNGLDLNKR
ncbi:MAG: hypothetical protein Q4F33_05580 [Mycoplasmatota bacterium]|nr:hypothetical protein [Mycoplasmatota bacterium]